MKRLRPLLLLVLLAAGAWYWRYLYQTPSYGKGQQAPDFELTASDGSTLRLSDFKGKHLLLDFWGSWCGPCRRANRELVELYREYAPQGKLDVLSIGIEEDSLRWQRAIVQDNLGWKNHTSSLKMFDDPTARLYGVRVIPTLFWIDEQGFILAVNPDKEQIRKGLNR